MLYVLNLQNTFYCETIYHIVHGTAADNWKQAPQHYLDPFQ